MDTQTKRSIVIALYPTIRRKVLNRLTRLWHATRKRWIEKNPPKNGGWTCAVCHSFVSERHLSLDHIIMQQDDIELMLDLDNLQPTHPKCNVLRGDIMTNPKTIIRLRSLPPNHWERIIVERVLSQAQEAYRLWRLQRAGGHA